LEFLVAKTKWLRPQNQLKGVECEVWFAPGADTAEACLSFYANEMVGVQLKAPVVGLEPGQPVVFYREGEVLGGGVVDPMQASRWAIEST
jgi:tRNA U34 2-thiouridine synthase MnmA/TrmU